MRPRSTGSPEHSSPDSPASADGPTTGAAFRTGQVVRLRPEKRDAYIALHGAVWPDVLAMIRACNITNYSIFERDGLMFSYFEYVGDDWDRDSAKMMSDPATRRWWKLTDPCQEPVGGHCGPRPWAPMTEIFHHG